MTARFTAAAAVGVVAFIAPANADVTLSARVWTGTSWGTSLGTDLNLIPHIQIGIFASYTDASAIAGLRYNIIGSESRFMIPGERSIDISSSGLGRQSPFTVGANALTTFLPNGGNFRIDDAGDAANSPSVGILSNQSSPYNPINDALIYRFNYDPGPMLTGLIVTITPSETAALVIPVGGGAPVNATVADPHSATIIFVPAPAASPLLVMFAIGATRRRRVTAIAA